MDEKFSAFLDNESTTDEADSVISALLRNPQARALWSRQHWLRTTLRGSPQDTTAALDSDFADRVMTAIAAEPSETQRDTPARARAFGFVARRSRAKLRWRAFAGTLAVASLAGVVVLTYQPAALESGGSGPSVTSARDSQAAPTDAAARDIGFGDDALSAGTLDSQAFASSVTASIESGQRPRMASRESAAQDAASNRWSSVSNPELRAELNSYVVEHNGLAQGYGLSASPSLVHAATYGRSTTQ